MSDFVGMSGGEGVYLAAGAASTSHHEVHALKVMIPLGSTVRVDGEGSRGPLIVPPNYAHAASSDGPSLTVLLEPEKISKGVLERTSSGIVALRGREGAGLVALARELALNRESLRDAPQRLHEALRQDGPRDPGRLVGGALEVLSQEPQIDLASLASAMGASPFHLSRQFKARVGLSLRRWRLWRRLVDAFALVMGGHSLVSAALEAGFSDQAHFNRSCRRLVGRTPQALLVRNSVQYWSVPES